MHDFGKFDARFQAKAPTVAVVLNPAWRGVVGEGFEHGSWGYHHLLAEEPAVRALLGSAVLPLLQAACGHHGALPSHRRPGTRPLPVDLREWDGAARRSWLRACIDHFGARGRLFLEGDLPTAAVELFAGFVAVSDWIGSQEQYFSYCADPMPLARYYEKALRTAERALSEIGLLPAPPSGASFRTLFPGYEPRDVQRITQDLSAPTGPCLVVIEAQMGAGKTEAALALAERLLTQGDASGVYMGLPTMATSNAVFDRVLDIAPRMFAGPVNLRLAHSRSRSNPAFAAIIERPMGDSLYPPETEAAVACTRWFLSRKRALLGQFGVGTIDQAMQAAMFVRHHFVRVFGHSLDRPQIELVAARVSALNQCFY